MGRPECRLVRFLFFVLVGCLVSCFDKTSLAAAAAAAEQDFPSKPWISDDELVFLRTFLGPGKVMLEFGSGGSTSYFAPMVSKLYSIEHNRTWCKKVRSTLLRRGITNVELHCVEPDLPRIADGRLPPHCARSSYLQYQTYISSAARIAGREVRQWSKGGFYDVLFIDGRARPQCAWAVLPLLRDEGSVVLVHDWDDVRRKYYETALRWYDVIEHVKGGPGLVALRRKSNVSATVLLATKAANEGQIELAQSMMEREGPAVATRKLYRWGAGEIWCFYPTVDVELTYKYALKTYKNGGRGVEYAKELIHLRPKHGGSLQLLATHYHNAAQYEESVKYSLRAIDVAPQIPYNHVILGLGQYKMGSLLQAEKAFTAVLQIESNNTIALGYLKVLSRLPEACRWKHLTEAVCCVDESPYTPQE